MHSTTYYCTGVILVLHVHFLHVWHILLGECKWVERFDLLFE